MDSDAQAKWVAITPLIEDVWGQIFAAADKIVKVHLKFGFAKFVDQLSPSIEEILLSLKTVEAILDTLHPAMDYSESRMAGNAKQQILWVQGIAEALQNNDEPRYNDAIQWLSKQSSI